ncbi:MAG TPA: helix-turn-helix domain-containing protein [Streptosporangiaceae bacterium]|jgi:excisionase family DNA binding protein|nr:helix-turn-helix domain-containing protein [Streptosporangiaceae bacterium]
MQAYTVEQAAEIPEVGRDKIYQLLRTGQLRNIKIGSSAASPAMTLPNSSPASKPSAIDNTLQCVVVHCAL